MFDNLLSLRMAEVVQRALDIVQGQKTTMMTLKMALDDEGFPQAAVSTLVFPEGWFPLPVETFRGEGSAILVSRTDKTIVVYYMIKAGSYFIKHSAREQFSIHICYGSMSCTVGKIGLEKGATGQAKPNQLHQMCFPQDTGMTVTFDLV